MKYVCLNSNCKDLIDNLPNSIEELVLNYSSAMNDLPTLKILTLNSYEYKHELFATIN